MRVRECMTTDVVTVGSAHTLRQAARIMADRRVGSAVVLDGDRGEPGILTERDLIRAVAEGVDAGNATVGEHLSSDFVVGSPDWSVEQAAQALVGQGFRHLVVCNDHEVIGILSVRDVVATLADVQPQSPDHRGVPA